MSEEKRDVLYRRDFLRVSATGLAGLMTLPLVPGCRPRTPENTIDPVPPFFRRTADATGDVVEFRLTPAPGTFEPRPGSPADAWLYDGQLPGPEIRVREGDRLRVEVFNDLPAGTTVHWHGVPVPNDMDGVPGVTQDLIAAGDRFVYEFAAYPAGSYLYHTHVELQLDRGLFGPLIIEEASPHVHYDREYTVIVSDHLPGEPEPAEAIPRGRMRGPMRGREGMRGMMMDTPAYEALLVNGRDAQEPQVFETRRGERLRLRLMNPSGATTVRVALAGHRLLVTHTDGRPVEPHEVDSVDLSMGERVDVVVEAENPGAWNLVAEALEGPAPAGRAVVRYDDGEQERPPQGQRPDGLDGGRRFDLGELRSTEVEAGQLGRPDRTFDLTLSHGMMGGEGMMGPDGMMQRNGMMGGGGWTINGQAYPEADPLDIREGEHIRVRMTNHSPMIHPMHLHGHFFRVGDVLKDTVLVPPHMGQVTFDFVADNPGDWFFHCHNIYHAEAGMARVFRYR